MKKVWLESDKVCLAMGDAVAKNLMFETKQDHVLFFKFWNKYLGGMADLINYHLSPTGWVLLFKTKSANEIQTAYQLQRIQSKKANPSNTLHDVSRMLSEHFRIFLSQFVRRSNAVHRRRGTKVMESFHRYIFNEAAEYEQLFEMITRQIRKNPQKNPRYQADETKYDERKELVVDSVWKVGTRLYKGMNRGFREYFGVVLMSTKSPVLRKYLNSNKFHPIHPKPT